MCRYFSMCSRILYVLIFVLSIALIVYNGTRDTMPIFTKAPLTVLSHDLNGIWNENTKVCRTTGPGTATTLVTPFGNMTIHVHDPQKDIYISKRIIKIGNFDLHKISLIAKYLVSDLSLNFIDVGANIGTYSLSFAKMGRKVISIDALNLNIKKLCASVIQAHFEDRIYMVLNAISSSHETVTLAEHRLNFGGTFIDDKTDAIKSVKGRSVTGRHINNITTIVFDDLLKLPYISFFPRVFIKMDIEGFEHKALEKAHNFFKNIYVKGILMEWIFHQNKLSGQSIINFLEQFSFKPYNPNNLIQFPKNKMGDWSTEDVLWLRD